MSVLYPRLLDRTAHELHAAYVELTQDELATRAALHHPSAVFAATGGRQISREELRTLREELMELARAAGHPAPAARTTRTDFDLATARLLHARSGLVAAEAAARDAWAFLALVVAPDIAYWRFPRPPGDRILGTDITRHVFGRLWWRAHLLAVPDGGDRRYELLDAFGEAAFDQIFARRRRIGSSRPLVRALARAWPRQQLGGVNERDVLRDSLKRLLRLEAVIDFESLDDETLDAQVTETITESAQEIAAASGRRGTHRHSLDRSSEPVP